METKLPKGFLKPIEEVEFMSVHTSKHRRIVMTARNHGKTVAHSLERKKELVFYQNKNT